MKAFIKRAARVAASSEFKFEPLTGIASQAYDVQEMSGQEVSAEVLATLWRHWPEKDIDTEGCIKNACVQRLPFHWRADMLMWKVLITENEASKASGSVPFSYVDFTCRQTLAN